MGGFLQTALCRAGRRSQIYRNTHRCAISNNRIIAETDGSVEFWYKNTRKEAKWEVTSLPVMTFIARFLYHVLPKHFHRIRYYGFLANGKAGANIETIRQDLGSAHIRTESVPEMDMVCPLCEEGTMITILITDGFGNVITDNMTDDPPVAVPADST